MNDRLMELLPEAKGIAWDTCHKIYVLMDDEQMALMEEYGYDPLIYAKDVSRQELEARLEDWYDNSCSLRFIDAVWTDHTNPNNGFEVIIPQGGTSEEDEA